VAAPDELRVPFLQREMVLDDLRKKRRRVYGHFPPSGDWGRSPERRPIVADRMRINLGGLSEIQSVRRNTLLPTSSALFTQSAPYLGYGAPCVLPRNEHRTPATSGIPQASQSHFARRRGLYDPRVRESVADLTRRTGASVLPDRVGHLAPHSTRTVKTISGSAESTGRRCQACVEYQRKAPPLAY